MSKKNKLKIYSSKIIQLTDKERADYERRMQREKEKRERDSICGGIDELGNYTALHHR